MNFSPIELYSFKKEAYSIVNYFMGKSSVLVNFKMPHGINVCMFFWKITIVEPPYSGHPLKRTPL